MGGGDVAGVIEDAPTTIVHLTVMWAKFQALAEGDRLATERLWA